MILGFSKKEFSTVFVILTVISVVTAMNFQISYRKSRDNSRKNDLRAIADALNKYNTEFGFYPLSSQDGKIVSCKGEINDKGIPDYRPCEWYKDGLVDIFDENYAPYLKTIPGDPQATDGVTYFYISNGKYFQIYASLEARESEYRQDIADLNIKCGERICNFGRASGETPLDKSLEQYENELKEKNETK
jgi:type II secretory pathway pseudopilin PulG